MEEIWKNNKWHSQININNRPKSLGFYINEKDASIVYECALEHLLKKDYSNVKL